MSGNRRLHEDIVRLMNKHQVTMGDKMNEFTVKLHGPCGTAYEGGVWHVAVHVPRNYPFSSPSIGFVTKIYHPNVDFPSGTICLDVINEMWTPVYDLSIIFDTFLPQLLTYPNPDDPLNGEAANLLRSSPESYLLRVKKFVKKFAIEFCASDLENESEISSTSSSSQSDLGMDA